VFPTLLNVSFNEPANRRDVAIPRPFRALQVAVVTGPFEDLENLQINLRSGEQRHFVALRLDHPERMDEGRYRDDAPPTHNQDCRQAKVLMCRLSLGMTA
jgi:hypothetical protein